MKKKTVTKMDPLKLGVVGWGSRGGAVARVAYDALGGMLATTACVEPSETHYRETCKAFELNPRRHASIEEMLAKEELDGVMIASPNHLHLEHLRALRGSGLPILLEKPLDSSFERICDVVRFEEEYDAPILVGHCMRYAPILQEAKKMLRRGDIGKICSARFVQHCHYGNAMYHNWRRQKAMGGGMLLEKATHDFDIMLWFLESWPETVGAFGALQAFGGDKPEELRCRNCDERVTCPESTQNISWRYGVSSVQELERTDDLCVFSSVVDAHDNEQTLIRFANGAFGSYVQWFFSPRGYHHRIYEVQGTEGAMEVDLGESDGKILLARRYSAPTDRQEIRFDYVKRTHYNADGEMVKHFYQVLRGAARPETTVKQAFAAELLGYAANHSVADGRFVEAGGLLPKDLARLGAEGKTTGRSRSK